MIDVILPVLDEAAAIPRVLRSLPFGYRPIVIDNGSTDGSAAVARDLGATVVSESRRGFGAACYAGLVAATADIVCFMDCDGSLDGAYLPGVADPIAAETADAASDGTAAWAPSTAGPSRLIRFMVPK